MFKIHCVNNIAKVGTDRFGENYSFVDDAVDADAVVVRSANLHEVEIPSTLLAIARAGAGYNNIPIEKCAQMGTVVFNTPGANANAVKEMTIAGLLLGSRDILGSVDWVRTHSDDPDIPKTVEKVKKNYAGTELAGKTIVVIGLGAIGAQVANTCRHLGMTVLGYDPYLSVNAAWSLDRHIAHVNKLADVLPQADYITLHVPVVDATKGMIGAEELASMKDGVIIVNYARDLLVDEIALSAALQSGKVRRYVTDFANSVSTQMPNTIITTHLGASTHESEDNCAVMAADELKEYLEHGNIINSVNFGRVDLGPKAEGKARICIFNKNVPNMIGQITGAISEAGLNIENMANKASGEVAYTLVELDAAEVDDQLESKLASIEGIVRIRTIQ